MKNKPMDNALKLLQARPVEGGEFAFLSQLSSIELLASAAQLVQLEEALKKVQPEQYEAVREAWISGLNWKNPPLYALELTLRDVKGNVIAPGFFKEYLEKSRIEDSFLRAVLTSPKYPAPLLTGPDRNIQYLTYTVIRDDYVKFSEGAVVLTACRPSSIEEMKALEQDWSLRCNTWDDFIASLGQ